MNEYFNDQLLKIVASVLTIFGAGVSLYKVIGKWRSRRLHEREMSLFFGDERNFLEYKRNFVRTKSVDRPPDDEDDFRNTQYYANKIDLISFFIKNAFKSKGKLYFLILADAGMGKTTFLVNLFLEYSNKIIGKKYFIKYVALGDPFADDYIKTCKDDGSFYKDGSNTILLLDAFDEDPKALDNYSNRFNELIHNCRTFAKIIITSRTQFFPEEDKEKFTEYVSLNDKKGSYLTVAKKYIAPFSDKEVSDFLKKKYSRKFKLLGQSIYLNYTRKIAEDICIKATNLVARPMLLENIDLIILENKKFNYEYEIYETLIQSWIARESKKQKHKQPDENKFKKEMNEFIEKVALHCYNNYVSGNGMFIESNFLLNIARENSIELDKIDLSARSLLNRNSKGRFKFSHKTILEFLLAKYDMELVKKESFINFHSFDFGLYIRNQIAFLKSIRIFQPLFLYISSEFKLINPDQIHSIQSIEQIIAVNYDTFVLRKLRFFQNLKVIYILDVDPRINFENDQKLKAVISGEIPRILLGASGFDKFSENIKDLVVYDKLGNIISYSIYLEPILRDEFFLFMKWKVYKIRINHNWVKTY